MRMLQVPFSKKAVTSALKDAQQDTGYLEKLFQDQAEHMLDNFDRIVLTKKEKESYAISTDEKQKGMRIRRNTKIVMDSVFAVLKNFLTGHSRKNELYISRHLPFLWSMYGTEMDVEPMTNELLRDNQTVIDLIGESEMDRVIKFLEITDKPEPDFLEFFSVLCVCGDHPNNAKQSYIGKKLLHRKDPPVYLTEPSLTQLGTIDVKTDRSDRSTSKKLHEMLNTQEGLNSDESLFLQRQLELYGNLCKGRHKENIEYITVKHKHLTWEECFLCVQCDGTLQTVVVVPPDSRSRSSTDFLRAQTAGGGGKSTRLVMLIDTNKTRTRQKTKQDAVLQNLPSVVRKLYTDLITSLFVDVQPNFDVLSNVDLSFNWKELQLERDARAKDDQRQSLTGARFEHFPPLKSWIASVLKDTEAMIHSDPKKGAPKNKLLESVLKLLHYLVVFGYYADPKDIETLMMPLQGVINGENDKKTQDMSDYALKTWRGEGRFYVNDDDTRVVVAAKFQALRCIDALYNFVFNIKVRYLLCDFKLVAFGNECVTEDYRARLQQLKGSGFFSFINEVDDADVTHDAIGGKLVLNNSNKANYRDTLKVEQFEKAAKYLDNLATKCDFLVKGWKLQDGQYLKQTHGHKAVREKSLVGVLLDLAKYRDPRLLQVSMRLINRIYSSSRDLLMNAVQSVVLKTKTSTDFCQEVKQQVPNLRRFAAGKISGSNLKNFNETLCYLTAKCYRGGKGSTLEPFSPLFCHKPLAMGGWREPGDPYRPAQEIVFNSGCMEIALGVVGVPNQEASVLRNCFWFLRAICCGFEKVQIELYRSLDIILNTQPYDSIIDVDWILGSDGQRADFVTHAKDEKEYESWPNSMGACIAQIFDSCKETCLRMRESQVSKLLERITFSTDEQGNHAKFHERLVDAQKELRNIKKIKEKNDAGVPEERIHEAELALYDAQQAETKAHTMLNNCLPPQCSMTAQTLKSPNMLKALYNMIKVEQWNLPLKRKQELISQYVWKFQKEVVRISHIDDTSDDHTNEQRMNLLRQTKPSTELEYHCNLVSLLAGTAEGKFHQIETMCRSIFSLDDLLTTICDPDIPSLNKGPYIMFLFDAYMEAQRSATQIGTDKLFADDKLFQALENICVGESAYLANHKKFPPAHAVLVYDRVMPLLQNIVHHHFPDKPEMQTSLVIATHALMEVVKVDRSWAQSGYRAQRGFDFFDKMFRLMGGINAASHKKHAQNEKNLAVSLKEVPLPGDKKGTRISVRLVADAVGGLLKIISEEASLLHANIVQSLPTDEQEESHLNDKFNMYARKFLVLYEWQNTTRSQLMSQTSGGKEQSGQMMFQLFEQAAKSAKGIAKGAQDVVQSAQGMFAEKPANLLDRQYSEQNTSMNPLRLPLGPEFQALVHLLIDVDTPEDSHFDVLHRLFTVHFSSPEHERIAMCKTVVKMLQVLRCPHLNLERLGANKHKKARYQDAMINAKTSVEENTKTTRPESIVVPLTYLLDSPNPDVKRECVAGLLVMLDNGHYNAQQAMLQYFEGTREENFFHNVEDIITHSVDTFDALRTLRDDKIESDVTGDALAQTMRLTISGPPGNKTSKRRGKVKGAFDAGANGVTSVASRARSKGLFAGLTAAKLEKVHVTDGGILYLLLELLRCMCEGNARQLQDYIQRQEDNLKSVDVVTHVVEALEVLITEIDQANFPLITRAFEAITEFVQGNERNRRIVFDNKVIDHVNELIRCGGPQNLPLDKSRSNGKEHSLKKEHRTALVLTASEFLSRMLETNDVGTKYLATEINKSLDLKQFHLRLWEHVMARDQVLALPDGFKEDTVSVPATDVSILIYIIFRRLRDFTGKRYIRYPALDYETVQQKQRKAKQLTGEDRAPEPIAEKEMLRRKLDFTRSIKNSVVKNCASVELYIDDRVQKVYFNVPQAWRARLRNEMKDDLIWKINRDSHNEQLSDFMVRSKVIVADIKYMEYLLENPIARTIVNRKALWSQLLLAITVGINVLMVIAWVPPDATEDALKPTYSYDGISDVMDILGWVHVVVSTLVGLSYFLANPPSFGIQKSFAFVKGWWLSSDAQNVDKNSDEDNEVAFELDLDADVEEEDEEDETTHVEQDTLFTYLTNNDLIKIDQNRSTNSIFSAGSIYHIILIALSITGKMYYGYTFSFHLLHMVTMSDILGRVLQAVTSKAVPLAYVGLLMLVIIYIYTLIAFAGLRRYYDNSGGAYCDTLYQCLVSSLRMGLLAGGGLGDALPFDATEVYGFSAGWYSPAVRTIFDLTFFIIVTTIGLNVVFGIIVDSFSELRDEKYQIEEAKKSECLICGLKASDFDQYGNGWKTVSGGGGGG